MKRILFSIVCISLIFAAFAKADVSNKNAQDSAQIDVAGVVNGKMVFMYYPLQTLEDGKWKLTGVIPLEGSYLKSGQTNVTPIRSVAVIIMKPPLEELYTKHKIAQPFLPQAIVEKVEESILHSVDITPGEDCAYVEAIMNDTKANITAHTEDRNIQLGVGSSLNLLLVESSGKIMVKSLLGYPGSELTLQPQTSVVWKGMNLYPGGDKPVTFTFGFLKGIPVISKITSGELRFSRRDSKGDAITGVLQQTEEGVIEKVGENQREQTAMKVPAFSNKDTNAVSHNPVEVADKEMKQAKISLEAAKKSIKDAEEALRKTQAANLRPLTKDLPTADMSDKNAQLIQAAKDGNLPAVQTALSEGAEVNARDTTHGGTPLIWTSYNSHAEVIKLLLEKGAEINAKANNGATALMMAAYQGHTEIIKLLLEKGADVNAKSKDGITALWQAAQNGHTEVVKLLLEKGAEVNAKDTDGGTALMVASESGHTEVVKLLLDKGADVSAKDNKGVMALYMAANNGYTETVKLLLEKGADINAKDTLGTTALVAAAYNGHTEIVKLLLEKGADVNVKSTAYGGTALMMAARRGHTEIVKLLLEKGADINAKTDNGRTALGEARGELYTDIVQLLEKAGAKE